MPTDAPIRRRIPGGIWSLTAAFSLAAGLAVLARVWTFRAGAFDLGFFVQALAVTARHGPLAPTPMTDTSLLADHFAPLALPLAPLGLLPAAPYLLVLAQLAAVAAALPLAWSFARSRAGSTAEAGWLTVAFATAPVLLFALWNDFHTSLLAAPFLILFGRAVLEGRGPGALAWGTVSSLAREDIAFLVLVLSVLYVGRMWRWLVPLVAVALSCLIVRALFSPAGGWFEQAGLAFVDASQPLETITTALDNAWAGGELVLLVAVWLVPWVAWAPLARKPVIAAAVFALPYLVVGLPHTKYPGLHYYFPLAVLGLWSAVEGRRTGRVYAERRSIVAAFVLVAFLVGPLTTSAVARDAPTLSALVGSAVEDRTLWQDLHAWMDGIDVAGGASVEARVFPVVAGRGEVTLWPSPFEPVVLRLSEVPIIAADSTWWPPVVIAPSRKGVTTVQNSPTASEVGLPEAGFERVDISPGGFFEEWSSGPEFTGS